MKITGLKRVGILFLTVFTAITQLFLLSACSDNHSDSIIEDGNVTNSLESTYVGYYLTVEDGIITITNYDPDDLNNMPSYQEVIEYGDGVGLENDGIVYWVYILDSDSIDTETGEDGKYYMGEFADGTHQSLTEEDQFFASVDEKQVVVDKLIEMVDFAKEGNNE